jgi:tripartite-type tricarboxylate transporter receptor subunit TctC
MESRRPSRYWLRLALLALPLWSAAWDALAQPASAAYPTKPIRMIVPFAPGGPNDVVARLISPKLTEQLGQSVLIENRGGAGGTIGMDMLAKLPADGYAFAVGGSSNLAVAPSLYEKLGYDPVKDFAPITNCVAVPYVLAVNPTVPARNVKELIALASRKPGYLSYGSSGTGSMSSLAAELFKHMSKTDIVHVPYKGTAPALSDVVSGQIEMMFADLGVAQAHAKAGRLRLLGISTPKRSRAAPQLPTIAEAALPGYEVSPWFGLVAPAGIPHEIVAKINSIVAATLKSQDMLQRLDTLGYEPIADSPEHFASTIKSDIVKYHKIVQAAGIKIEN